MENRGGEIEIARDEIYIEREREKTRQIERRRERRGETRQDAYFCSQWLVFERVRSRVFALHADTPPLRPGGHQQYSGAFGEAAGGSFILNSYPSHLHICLSHSRAVIRVIPAPVVWCQT